MPRETFFSRLDEEEERKSNEFSQRRVGFVSPKMKQLVLGIIAAEGFPSLFPYLGGPLRKGKIAGITALFNNTRTLDLKSQLEVLKYSFGFLMIDGSENANVSWLLNFRVRAFLKSAVKH